MPVAVQPPYPRHGYRGGSGAQLLEAAVRECLHPGQLMEGIMSELHRADEVTRPEINRLDRKRSGDLAMLPERNSP